MICTRKPMHSHTAVLCKATCLHHHTPVASVRWLATPVACSPVPSAFAQCCISFATSPSESVLPSASSKSRCSKAHRVVFRWALAIPAFPRTPNESLHKESCPAPGFARSRDQVHMAKNLLRCEFGHGLRFPMDAKLAFNGWF